MRAGNGEFVCESLSGLSVYSDVEVTVNGYLLYEGRISWTHYYSFAFSIGEARTLLLESSQDLIQAT